CRSARLGLRHLDFLPPAHHSDRTFWAITDQDVAIAQRVICDFKCQMPSVPPRALLVHDDSLLRVCPSGGTLCNDIIGVADIADGHTNRRSRPAIFTCEDRYLPPSTYQRSNMYALMSTVITANRAH